MTTIAWKHPGILACDKQATNDGLRQRAASKLQQRGDRVFAIAGNLASGLAFIDWLHDRWHNPEECPLDDMTCVVEMDKRTGKCQVWESPGVALPVEDKIFAAGSGGAIALGAMAAGLDPVEAVKIAAAWDDGTGMGVQVVCADTAKREERAV